VKSDKPLSGLVQYFCGGSKTGKMTEIFTGFITKSTTVDRMQQRIFCRELSAVLWKIIPVSIKNASLKDILNIYTRKTGLEFITPETGYSDLKHHTFQSVGNGIHGLDSLGGIFKIKNFFWQQINGQVFVGSWDDSKWTGKEMNIPEKFFQDVQLDGTKTLQVLPGLKPGVKVNSEYVTSLQLKEHFMVIRCEKQLNV
jgi:hypothetical protein